GETNQVGKRPGAAERGRECQQVCAGKRILHRFCAPVNRGFLGGADCEHGAPLAPCRTGGAPPKRVFGFFLHEQKETRPAARKRNPPVGAEPDKPKDPPAPPAKRYLLSSISISPISTLQSSLSTLCKPVTPLCP